MAFDIETSRIFHPDFVNSSGKMEPIAFMYIWQFCVEDIVIIGRRWSEFYELLQILMNKYSETIVIYVHNLSYEYQFFRNFLPVNRVFSKNLRRVVTADAFEGRIQFRCSWALSNMSLEKLTKKTPGVLHVKAKGNLDYSIVRYWDTPINDTEMGYNYNDVRGLVEAIKIKLKNDNDNISSIPLTSTGYVRRRARNAMLSNPKNRQLFVDTQLSEKEYKLLLDVSEGGDVHGNPNYTGIVLDNIDGYDIKSSYPYYLVAGQFPMTKFQLDDINVELLRRIIENKKFCVFARFIFINIKCKTLQIPPYIKLGKCTKSYKVKSDNGRVVSAALIEIGLTDLDFEIIDKLYTFDDHVLISDARVAEYGYLPDELRDLVLHDFINKCKLDGVDDYLYSKYKNDFNSYFGMMLQKIIDVEYVLENGIIKKQPIQNYLAKHYNKKNNFLPFQWGVWTNAGARHRLYQGYFATKGLAVYGDTDSIKGFACKKFNTAFDNLNEIWRKEAEECGKQIIVTLPDKDSPGKNIDFCLGKWEKDCHYYEFVHLGAKKYCYTDAKGTHITVAGLSKEDGRKYIDKIGGIDQFKVGLEIPEEYSGRTTAYWHDYDKPFILNIDGHMQEIGSNVAIVDTTYKLNISDIYDELVQEIQCES